MSANDGRVVSNFVVQALLGKDLTIFGDGSQTRSFCFVDDLVDGLTKVMNSAKPFDGPVNLGNPNEFTMIELANLVIETTNSNSRLVFCDLPGDDPKQRQPDITKAKSTYDWEPKVQLREGLKKTAEYFAAVI
jgi:UDP-glucuronate decarboxylase